MPLPTLDQLAEEFLRDKFAWPNGASAKIAPAVTGFAKWLAPRLENLVGGGRSSSAQKEGEGVFVKIRGFQSAVNAAIKAQERRES